MFKVCGDPDENRQASLPICCANVIFFVPFGSAVRRTAERWTIEFDSLFFLSSNIKRKNLEH